MKLKTYWSGGVTTQLYIEPEYLTVKDDFDMRISSATINIGESNFTKFEGYERILIVLKGSTEISHNDSEYKKIKKFIIYRFSGDDNTKSKTTEECIDFNVIWKKGLYQVEATINEKSNEIKIKVGSMNFIYLFNENAEEQIIGGKILENRFPM